MAHDKVYGICENKCMVEIYSKREVFSREETSKEIKKANIYSPEESDVIVGIWTNGEWIKRKVILCRRSDFDYDDNSKVYTYTLRNTTIAVKNIVNCYCIVKDVAGTENLLSWEKINCLVKTDFTHNYTSINFNHAELSNNSAMTIILEHADI